MMTSSILFPVHVTTYTCILNSLILDSDRKQVAIMLDSDRKQVAENILRDTYTLIQINQGSLNYIKSDKIITTHLLPCYQLSPDRIPTGIT